MRNTSFTITVPHLFSPISALSAEIKPYIIQIVFQYLRNALINQSDLFLIFNNIFVRERKWSVCAIQRET